MTIESIIITLLCAVVAYCVGRTVGIAKGFSDAYIMLEKYRETCNGKGGDNAEADN